MGFRWHSQRIVRAQIFVCKAIDNTYPTVCNIYGKAVFTPPTRKGLGTKLVAYFLLPVFSFFRFLYNEIEIECKEALSTTLLSACCELNKSTLLCQTASTLRPPARSLRLDWTISGAHPISYNFCILITWVFLMYVFILYAKFPSLSYFCSGTLRLGSLIVTSCLCVCDHFLVPLYLHYL